ncbi:MAG TPA: YncE family protein [Nitrosopumilaceae archaeon]|nr:YncE family protein [Nitrosopumilaceae archaeon]
MKQTSFFLLLLFALSSAVNAQSGYHVGKTFHIASPGGWAYPASDPGSNKLYLSHGSQVNILDKTTGDSLGFIPNTTGVHGIAFDDALGKGYTSNGRLNSVTVFDLKTGDILGQVAVGKNPDWIMYDPFSKKIITSNLSDGALSVIDPATDEVVATISLDGAKLETVVSDNAGKLFVNAEDKNEIIAIDIVTNKVVTHWPLGAEGPTGLAIDVKTKRLFSICNKTLVVMDATNGKMVASLPIGDGSDQYIGAAFDPLTRLAFAAKGDEGTLTVIKEVSANEFKVIDNVKTKRGARTITIDEKTHKLFLPTADYEPLPAEPIKNSRPKMIDGSFQVLVLEK